MLMCTGDGERGCLPTCSYVNILNGDITVTVSFFMVAQVE